MPLYLPPIINGTTLQTNANFNIQSASASSVGGIIRGATSQTANLQEWQNSAGTILANVNSAGFLSLGALAPTHTLTLPSTATGITLYNTADQTTNFERLRIYNSSNVHRIEADYGGTQGPRDILVGNVNATIRISNSQGSNGAITVNRSILTVNNAVIMGITSTFSGSANTHYGLSIIPTINQSGTSAYTALLINPTETATGSGAKNLINAQVGGTSRLRIDNVGNTFISNTATSGISLFNTADQTTNFERGRLFWESNALTLRSDIGGTGTSNRSIRLATLNRGFTINTNTVGGSQYLFDGGTFGTTTAAAMRYTFTSDASSGIHLINSIEFTATQTSTAGYTVLRLNATETTTGSGAKNLIDAQVGGTSRFRVDNLGNTVISSAATTGLQLFNTADQTTNFERVRHYWSGNVYNIVTETAGTGTARNLLIGWSTGLSTVYSSGTTKILNQTGSTGSNGPLINNTATSTASSGTTLIYTIQPTINQSSTAGYTALLINLTETATGSGAKNLIDAQVGGVSRFTVSNTGTITIADGANIDVGSTNGTKIGLATTEKLAFWNATPIVQPTTAVAEAVYVENSGGVNVNDDSTFDGYTLRQVVKALRNAGLLA